MAAKKKKNRAVAVFLGAQITLVVAVGAWLLLGDPDPQDPTGPAAWFEREIAALGEQATADVQDVVGRDVMRAANESCHRESCIRARFDAERGKWAAAAAAKGVDPCAGYRSEACTRERVVAALRHVLRYASVYECDATDLPPKGKFARIRVTCGATSDTVRLTRIGEGRYAFVGEPRFPGILPVLFEQVATLD